jgi:hypothetical protein
MKLGCNSSSGANTKPFGLEPTQVKNLSNASLQDMLLALPKYVRLGYKGLQRTDSLLLLKLQRQKTVKKVF